MRIGVLAIGLWIFAVGTNPVRAGGPTLAGDVLPLLKARCVKCHGPVGRKGGLNLATPRGLARGGKGGAAVVPGRAEGSPLWDRVADDEMPPKAPLAAVEKDLLRRWIESGAPGLPEVPPGTPEGSDHWAFAPLNRPEPPAPRDPSRARTAVDRFVLARLDAEGVSLAPEAGRAVLIRRLCFDLTGLPPTPGEVAAFEADPSPVAYERLVDRLLASPRYGERWGKFWLDAAGYADSNGYFSADSDRPLAWRYRDSVTRALNADTSFDRFVVEQIAGDELSGYRPGMEVTPAVVDRLAATHYLRNSQDGTGESDGNADEVRADRFAVLEGTVQIVGSSLLGLTLQCARCHDHKFEPVTQKDYSALQAVLSAAFPAGEAGRWVKPNDRVVVAAPRAELAPWEARDAAIVAEITALKKAHHERVVRAVQGYCAGQRFVVDDLGGARKALDREVAAREARRLPNPGRIAWVTDLVSDPAEFHLLKRGDYSDPGPVVAPAAPAVLSDADNPFDARPPSPGAKTTGRRLALARWLTRPGSRPAALLARVTVNRAWQHHFGTGIVATPENLGVTGTPPSHPELLDFLAAEFVRGGWSLKALHRLIVGSAAYRQSGTPLDAARATANDPDARLLSRYPLRRLDAEAVRDAMLSVSGDLDPALFGPYVPSQRLPNGEVIVDDKAPGSRRRSVYLQQRRTQVVSVLEVFDAPSVVTNCPRRSSSTIPLQSLSLLNSAFSISRARAFAHRLSRDAGPDRSARLTLAFLLTSSRPPDDSERSAALRFLASQPSRYPSLSSADSESRAWADLCQMLLAGNAFLYME